MVKKGDVLSPLFFNFPLEYTIRMIQAIQDGLKLNGTYQPFVCAFDVITLRGSVYTTKEKAEVLVVASKEIGLEVNVDKSKYMVMSRDQNAGRSYSMNIDNSSIERLEGFKYLGTSLTLWRRNFLLNFSTFCF